MDGVLTDSEPIHDEALTTVLAAQGYSLTEDDRNFILGTTLDGTWQLLQDRLSLAGALESWKERYSELVCRLLPEQVEPAPGLYGLLSNLGEKGLRLALASSSPREWIDLVLEKLKISRRFEVVIAGDEVERGKPDPEIYQKAAQSLSLPPDRCLVIEDSPAGMKAARYAGMKTVAVRTAYTEGQDLSDADWIIGSLGSFDYRLLAPD